MQELIARILLPFLLLAQVGAGMSPGRVLCIAVDCGGECVAVAHAHAHPPAHSHAHGHDCEHRHAAGVDHDAAILAPNGCDCHIHVSMPDDVGASRNQPVACFAELWLLQPALVQHLPTPLENASAEPPEAPPRECWTACDQCRARAVTRLLI